MNVAIDITDDMLDEIAQRVATLNASSKQSTPEPWLNVEQAAAHLGISTSQMYSLCSARRVNGIPVTKEGSRSYFKATELDRWRTNKGDQQ